MWDPYAEFQTATLDNGLTVHAAHWPNRPWVRMGFLVHTGGAQDPVGLEGLAHFIEHLVSENAPIPKKELEALFLDCGGGVHLGATGYFDTHYGCFVPTDPHVIARVFDAFGSMLLTARLQHCVEREREVIHGEFRQRFPLPFLHELALYERRALHAGFWPERSARPLGAPNSIALITQHDLQTHYDAHYTPANMSIVAVGGIELPTLVRLLSASPFAVEKPGMRTPLATPAMTYAPPSETRHICHLAQHITAPISVGAYRSIAAIPRSISMPTLRILDTMLSEALWEAVREQRAWSYDIDCSRRHLGHVWEFAIGCDALSLHALDKIEEVVEQCIASLVDREDAFAEAQRRAIVALPMTDMTARTVCDATVDDLAFHQRIILYTEIHDELARITMDDIRAALAHLRPERRWTLIKRP
ncbi:MAG: insulinase family protein [bacterium]|nr:insulinase family protein [bacterium]